MDLSLYPAGIQVVLVSHMEVCGSFYKSVSKLQCRKVVLLPTVYSTINEIIFAYVLPNSVVFMRKVLSHVSRKYF